MTTPSSQVPRPPPLWPPPRTASSASWSRAKATARDDVGGARAADDQRRAPVDHRVVDGARVVVVGVGRDRSARRRIRPGRGVRCPPGWWCSLSSPSWTPRSYSSRTYQRMTGSDHLCMASITADARCDSQHLTIGLSALHPSFPFVGRAHELHSLEALVPTGSTQGRRIVLVGGEPGSGKSRLVRELASLATESGARVVDGALRRGLPDAVPAVRRGARRSCSVRRPDDVWRPIVGDAGERARAAPARTSARPGRSRRRSSGDPDTERHRTAHRGRRPARAPPPRRGRWCWWSRTATGRMSRRCTCCGTSRGRASGRAAGRRHVPRHRGGRAVRAGRGARRPAAVGDVVRLQLAGLTTPEIDELVCRLAATTRRAAQPDLVAAIADLTAGNPFLITELWRALQDGAAIAHDGDGLRLIRPLADVATPEGVREVVAQRVARAGRRRPATCSSWPPSVGPEFDLEVVAPRGRPERSALRRRSTRRSRTA